MLNMKTMRSDLVSQGWSRQKGTLEDLRLAASFEGLLRANGGKPTNERRLVPYETEKAPRHSLSAVYGLGAQPLHSDGAHLHVPPDVVVLHSAEPSPTATVIWAPTARGADALPAAARAGVFAVRGNRESFLAAVQDSGGIRFDPVVMSPGDSFARETMVYLEAARSRATVHRWDESNVLLFINNRRALHAREEVVDAATRTITRVVYQWNKK